MIKEVKSRFELGEEDKVEFSFRKERGQITHFTLQYFARIDGHWRAIKRFDTCDGYAHEHKNGRREFLGKLEDYGKIYTEAYKDIQENYLKYKEQYIRYEQKHRGKKL